MTAKLTKNPASFTAWSIERKKERKHRRLQSDPTFEAQYKRKETTAYDWEKGLF
jgi:hypothetical protein